jgi:alpha-galactosidase
VKKRADALVSSGLSKLGYNFIFLDDCWADKERDAQGRLQGNTKTFPKGMKELADYVHSKGLYLALYTCIGTKTCKRDRPGSYGNYDLDAKTFAEWGVDMVKCDNCANPEKDKTQQLFTQFSKSLNETGREMMFALCEWGEDQVWNWGPGISQMYRIQMDHLPFFNFGATAAGVGYGQGVHQIIDWMADIQPSKFAGPGAWADPDFLMTMFDYLIDTMPFEASKTEFTFWSLWSSPLLVATDVVNMSDQKKQILMNEEVLAIHQDQLWKAGDRLFNNTDGTQAWQRPLQNGDVCVVLFNAANDRSDSPKSISVDLTSVGFKADEPVYIRDLWQHANLQPAEGQSAFTNSIQQSVGKHASVMLRVSRTPFKDDYKVELPLAQYKTKV